MPPKKNISLEVLDYKSDQNMIDHAEIKTMITNLSNTVVNMISVQDEKIRKQDEKMQLQEEKFIMRKEAWAVSGAVGFVAILVGIATRFF